MMYRLLIVDDEHMIVDWLYNMFSELTYLELDIYKATSGLDAIKCMNRTKIDIVLADIRMPEMNGLQLLENIRLSWPECKVIFLTGYNEFDYIYTAIQRGGVSYLLKTEDDSEIIKAVEKAIEEIKKSYKNMELINKAKEQLNLAVPLLQREYLTALLSGEESVLPLKQEQLNDLEIPLKAEHPFILLLGRIDNLSKKLGRIEKSQLIYMIKLTVEQYLLTGVTATYVLHEDSHLVWFIQPKDLQLSWERTALFARETLEAVQKVCIETLNINLSFSISVEPSPWELANERYYYLKQLLNSRVGFDSVIIIMGDDASVGHQIEICSLSQTGGNIHFKLNRVSTLQSYLESGQKDDFFELHSEITEGFMRIKSMHDTPALEVYFTLAAMLLSYINRWNALEKIAFKIGINKLTSVEEFDTWNDAADYLRQLAEIIFELRENDQEKRERDMVTKIQQYILEHLSEDISLVKLGELAYFNPSYLSRLFKQITGANISDYIQSARVNKAKELLSKNDMKVHEIAARVGYDSPAYFAKFFRKIVNMTPQEYRDSLIRM